MKTLILASGRGTRLLPLTRTLPKSLLQLSSQTILTRMITSLIRNGITDIVITTGFEHQKIVDDCRKYFNSKNVSFTFCYNPDFERTNYIQSFYLASKEIHNSDILLLHADLVYDEQVLKLLLKQVSSAMIVHKDRTTDKDFKVSIQHNKITQISTRLSSVNHLAMPFYRLTAYDLSLWLERITSYISEQKVSCYAEDALNEVLEKLHLSPLFIENMFCMEIDTLEDLKEAQEYFSRKSEPSSYYEFQ